MNLNLADALIVAAYVTTTIIIGFWISKRASRSIRNDASSDTRIHVAESTVPRLLDYAMNTPEDPLTSVVCVEQRYALIERNLAWRAGSGRAG